MVFEECKEFLAGNPDAIANCSLTEAFVGGVTGSFIALGIMAMVFIMLAFYVYHSFAWMTIGRKLKYEKPWFAWIPFVSTAMRLQLGGFHWAWTFLWLVPVLGWIALFVLLIISYWRIFEKRKYPGWFSLSMIVPKLNGILYLIVIGFVAWEDRKKMLFK